MSKNFFLLSMAIVIAGVLISGTWLYIEHQKNSELTASQAAQKAINYINQNKEQLTGGNPASLIKVTPEGSVYKIRIKIGQNEFDSYVTTDGKFLFPAGYNLEEKIKKENNQTSLDIPKRKIPDVKIFVMSYCPFGLQAQKMFLPVYKLLKEKAKMGIYFVDYIMHGKKEIDENLRQYCIQKERKEKYYDYLSCFVEQGNSEACLKESKIDKEALKNCIATTDKEYNITTQYNDKKSWLNGRYPRFNIHTDLVKKYGVRGSPTIVINDKVVNISPRSPESFKQAICSAFISQPEECNKHLSNQASPAGFCE